VGNSRPAISSPVGRTVAAVAGALRTAWLILGLTLLLTLGLEGLYRAQGAVRNARHPSPPHPNSAEPWWSDWVRADGAVNGPSRYDPYRGWWALPFESGYVRIDSLGQRRTVPPARGTGELRVVFLGGSVMWGYTSPDSLTIPSLVSQRLHAMGHHGVDLRNLAQPSYNTTQGLVSLLLELRSGSRPDVVISLDGNNDVLAAVLEHRAGAIVSEGDLARRSAVGWRGLGANVVGLLRYSELVRRLMGRTPQSPASRGAGAGLCDDVAGQYAQLVRAAEGLGYEFGFRPVFLWQPHLATTGKSQTPWERAIRIDPAFADCLRRADARIDSLMARTGDRTFRSLTHLFDADSATIFLDPYGHMTQAGNGRVADFLTDLLVHEIEGRSGNHPEDAKGDG
jgi:hypothetical protein